MRRKVILSGAPPLLAVLAWVAAVGSLGCAAGPVGRDTPGPYLHRGASMLEENKAIVQRFYDEVVNQGNLALLGELMAPGYIEHGNPAGSGIDGFERFFIGLGEAFPDLRITVEDLIAVGDRVVARVTVQATHQGTFMGTIAPTGRQVTFGGVDIFELAEGRIVGRWNHRDLLGLLQQLGAIPEPETGPRRAAPR